MKHVSALTTLLTAAIAVGCGPPGANPPPSLRSSSAGDTVRYTIMRGADRIGERLEFREPDGSFFHRTTVPFRRTSRLILDEQGLPERLVISGRKNPFQPWREEFARDGSAADWSTTVDTGSTLVDGPAYYLPIYPAHDLGVLARALLRQPDYRLPLLPGGEARLIPLVERVVAVNGQRRTVQLYGVDGIDLRRGYVWLDQERSTFAGETSVLSRWEAAFPELRAEVDRAIAAEMRAQAGLVIPPARSGPLVIRNVRLFDPEAPAVREGATIIIEGRRVQTVMADASEYLPPADAEVMDATGLMALPGLWDMHAHHDPERLLRAYAPFHVAAGVTTTRDMGSDPDRLLEFGERIERAEAIGPRIVMSGFIDGLGGSRTGLQVGDSSEAVAAVDRYARMGFAQIKIYNSLSADLVRVVSARAKHQGLRVSGHVPWAMTTQDAIEAGFDEIQHMTSLMEGVVLDPEEEVDEDEIAARLAALTPESALGRQLVDWLAAANVTVDPTLAYFFSAGTVPPRHMVGEMERFPEPLRRQRLVTSPPQWAGSRWEAILNNMSGLLLAFHEAGVAIVPGTDATPGFTLHEELELYAGAGIPAPEVLALATIGAARLMGLDDELGSIGPGKLADLILVDGDPTTDMADLRRVVTVIKDGRVFDPAEIYGIFDIGPCCR